VSRFSPFGADRRWPLTLLATGVLTLSAAACAGTDGDPASASTEATASAATDATDAADPTAPTSEDADDDAGTATTADDTSDDMTDDDGSAAAEADDDGAAAATSLGAVGGVLDSSVVHEITVEFDPDDYDAMIAAYTSTGEKETIEATVTIDGETFERVGMRLKGNSSLRGLLGGNRGGGGGGGAAGSASADTPESLPWLIELDEFVEGQSYQGLTDLVVRSNNSETALNEALALELLERAGLASQDAIATSFSVNGSTPALRLVIEHPDDSWMEGAFGSEGALYKAESSGDYSYRGDDPDAYDEVFDQEAGKDVTDLTPLIEFLDFINNADDATFDAELGEHLDIDAFATYLAMQELLENFDDIDGPGNNSYLYYDASTGRFTVVPWDYNLAFGSMGGGGGGGGARPGGPPIDVAAGDDAAQVPVRDGFGGPGGRTNVLVERFLANPEWQALYEDRLAELTASLFDSGVAADLLAEWQAVVESSGLVDATTVTSEADRIAAYF
jgi:spore coat protein CotH